MNHIPFGYQHQEGRSTSGVTRNPQEMGSVREKVLSNESMNRLISTSWYSYYFTPPSVPRLVWSRRQTYIINRYTVKDVGKTLGLYFEVMQVWILGNVCWFIRNYTVSLLLYLWVVSITKALLKSWVDLRCSVDVFSSVYHCSCSFILKEKIWDPFSFIDIYSIKLY